MVANRQDAWTEEDDLLLAEVVLRHIREGSTQLAAFDEVAERTGRTSAACGFRWNSTVRKKYEQAIAIAKAQRQLNKSKRSSRTIYAKREVVEIEKPVDSLEEQISYEAIIRFLKEQKSTTMELQKQLRTLQSELAEKEKEIRRLQEENQKMREDYFSAKTVSEDYKALIQIMDRARRLAFLGGEQEDHAVFKMDPNGNLERITK
jgi:prespore-specific regulator